jgi:two-component system OmpR family response regulator
MAKRIAIVEDDPDQRANYRDAITKKGYDVAAYASREAALIGIERQMPDLAILDIILGDEVDAGFQLCRDLLVRAPTLPVIFLTERIGEIDKISGLRLGAWDYLPKPISLDYLAERISSLLRINEVRNANSAKESTTARRVGDLSLDQEALLVSWKNQPINLSGTEFRMLANSSVRVMPSAETLMNDDAESRDQQHHQHAHAQHPQEVRESRRDFVHQEQYGYGYRWSVQWQPHEVER